MNTISFSELGLRPELLSAISGMGFEAPTPVQQQCIPLILEGRDMMGQAQTGTGKTAAFGLPILQNLEPDAKGVQTLVMCPTRELAVQVTGELMKLGNEIPNLNVVPVYGGQPIERQLKALKKGAHIVVGTPGRVIDHLNRGTLRLNQLDMVVLDEADEMLNMGFREDIETILSHTQKGIQSVMFSATNSPAIRSIMNKQMSDPKMITIDKKVSTDPDIEQFLVEVRDSMRPEAISRLMDVNDYKLGLVFCNTKRTSDQLVQELKARGYAADVIHGDITQSGRDKVMKRFRRGDLDLLVATDVAARGIDVSNVDVVFNYDIPQDPEYYVHRIGRTGRAGRSGSAYTFSSGKKKKNLKYIQRQGGVNMSSIPMPSMKDVEASRAENLMNEVTEILEKGGLKPWIEHVEKLAETGFSPAEIAAAFMKMNAGSEEKAGEPTPKPVASNGKTHHKTGEDMTSVHFSIGKNKKVHPGDLVGAIAGETGVPGKLIGEIEIYSNYTTVDVPADRADHIMKVMNRSSIKGTKIKVKSS